MTTILIAGASGVVGRCALDHLLASTDVSRIVAVGRRPLPIQHEKLESRIANLNDKADLLANLPDANSVAICALGTTMKQAGSQEAFRKVDHDAVLTFAEAARERGAQRLLLVSSVGANPQSSTFYLRTKGETEADVAKLGFPHLAILRPSFIDDHGARAQRRIGEQIGLPLAQLFFSVFSKTSRYAPISADTLGKALTRLTLESTAKPVLILEGKPLHACGN